MNGYSFWIDGRMTPPDFFSVRPANTATNGRLLYLTVGAESLKAVPKHVHVWEIRSGSVVRRYHCQEEPEKIGATDDEPARLRFKCLGVPNHSF